MRAFSAHVDDWHSAIGGARERLHDGPVRQDIGGHVDFVLGAIDKRHVDVFKIFARRIVNDRRGLGTAGRERDVELEGGGGEGAESRWAGMRLTS
jgi:hypothetical protein